MKEKAERHAYWKKIIEEQAQSGLSRREFCERHEIGLSKFSYYHLELKKKEQKSLSLSRDVVPIHLRATREISCRGEIKVVLPNGLQVLLPCVEAGQLKSWMEALRSC